MRALNMQALTTAMQRKYPGMTIYGIGDAAHKLEISDHNEDDTPGVRAAQSDADNIPEHRAIDAMLGTVFTKGEATALVARMVLDPDSKRRLFYIIWNRQIWSRDHSWLPETYNGSDPHINHVHFSGWAPEDDNVADWPIVAAAPKPTPPPPAPKPTVHIVKLGATGAEVGRIQTFFRNSFPSYRFSVFYLREKLLSVDNNFGQQTEAWVKEFQGRTRLVQDGEIGPMTFEKMRHYGYHS